MIYRLYYYHFYLMYTLPSITVARSLQQRFWGTKGAARIGTHHLLTGIAKALPSFQGFPIYPPTHGFLLVAQGTFSCCQFPCWEWEPAKLEAQTSNGTVLHSLGYSHSLAWPTSTVRCKISMTFHAQKQIIRFLKGRNSTSEILDDLRRYRAKLISLCSPKPKPETRNC